MSSDPDSTTGSSCEHYKRRCAFISPCCGKEYPCRLCHDDVELHVLDRFSVHEIKCTECNTKQEVGKECTNCKTKFGEYFCAICKLYDDNPKGQFHCEGCGLCRIGGRENFFHCEGCDMCLGMSLKDKHKCVEKVSRANCPVCMEDLHTSTSKVHVPSCHHFLHYDCYVELLKSGNYTCPICNVSLEEMSEFWRTLDVEIENTPMPEEYRDKKVGVLCRDCHKESQTLFHIIGLKCQTCGSYNTCGTDLPECTDQASASTETGEEATEGAQSTANDTNAEEMQLD